MRVFHQTGHNYKWNLDSLVSDSAGDGLILSPVNIEKDKVKALSSSVLERSFFDPQYYLPTDVKGKLATYDYFPSNMMEEFSTIDFETISIKSAKLCISFQVNNKFRYIVIPARYYDTLPSDYIEKQNQQFIIPFLEAIQDIGSKSPVLLTVLVKQEQLMDEAHRNLLLNWITGIKDITGVYLIFENNFLSKQIKDTQYLFNALTFIRILKLNDLEVHIGCTNTEGLLYSIANPDSITMGSYENLRNFNIKRYTVQEKKKQNGPNPRLYSGVLFQWIDYAFIEPIKALYPKWETLFEESAYKPLMFSPEFKWHFTKPELYKHFFIIFSEQVHNLPSVTQDRINLLKGLFQGAIQLFREIEESGVFLDDNSNGSHLSVWLNVVSMFEKHIKE